MGYHRRHFRMRRADDSKPPARRPPRVDQRAARAALPDRRRPRPRGPLRPAHRRNARRLRRRSHAPYRTLPALRREPARYRHEAPERGLRRVPAQMGTAYGVRHLYVLRGGGRRRPADGGSYGTRPAGLARSDAGRAARRHQPRPDGKPAQRGSRAAVRLVRPRQPVLHGGQRRRGARLDRFPHSRGWLQPLPRAGQGAERPPRRPPRPAPARHRDLPHDGDADAARSAPPPAAPAWPRPSRCSSPTPPARTSRRP